MCQANSIEGRPAPSVQAGPLAAPDLKQLRDILGGLEQGLIERSEAARALLLAVLSGEHLLLIGPPGTAKSELARRMHSVLGGHYFERLLTRFTVPEELFGPLSLAALDAGRYERDINGYLPTATVAFLDEVFKANSAILNALLTLLNERLFDQGSQRIAVPLLSLVAASNEVPQDDGLRAFFDRFLFRCAVAPVSDSGFRQLLQTDESVQWQWPTLSPDAIDAIDGQVHRVCLTEALLTELEHLRGHLKSLGIEVSDRRWVRSVRVLKVSALAQGREFVSLDDLVVLGWLLAQQPDQFAGIRQWVAQRLGCDTTLDPVWLIRVAQAFEKQLELEQSAGELAFDDSGKLALARSLAGADAASLAEGAPRLSAFSRQRRYGASHIAARIAQIDGVITQVDAFLERAERHRHALQSRLTANLWVTPGFAQSCLMHFDTSRSRVLEQRQALARARAGFAALPLSEEDDARVPEPITVALD
jgi:MoxR-like ATPase